MNLDYFNLIFCVMILLDGAVHFSFPLGLASLFFSWVFKSGFDMLNQRHLSISIKDANCFHYKDEKKMKNEMGFCYDFSNPFDKHKMLFIIL